MIDSKSEHKKHLIEKISKMNDKNIIDEIYRLLEVDIENSVYQTNTEQKKSIQEARQQIKEGATLSEKEANKEIDEWLEK